MQEQKIKEKTKERYGNIASTGTDTCCSDTCCTPASESLDKKYMQAKR
ncbi:MAG: hypothetical protein ACR2IS_19930 [Nitrososphaeraceae archaeon]